MPNGRPGRARNPFDSVIIQKITPSVQLLFSIQNRRTICFFDGTAAFCLDLRAQTRYNKGGPLAGEYTE